jgi:ABC-type glycerol-3-phosphate transport system substrate-binding protein
LGVGFCIAFIKEGKMSLTRRALLRNSLLFGSAAVLAACQPQIVKETVEVEKIVQQTVVVKETVIAKEAPKAKIKLEQTDYQNYEPNSTVLDELVADFNAYYPEYELKRMSLSGTEAVVARYAAGDQPTIHEDVQRDILGLIDKGALLPVQDFVDADPAFPRDWLPNVWKRYTHRDGKIYCMAEDGQATYFVLNQDMFDKAGIAMPGEDWTNDEVLDLGMKFTIDQNGKHPNEAGFDANNVKVWGVWEYPWANLCSAIWLHYGAAITDPNDHSKVTVNSPEMLEAMAWRCKQVLPPPNGPMHTTCELEPTFYDGAVAIRSEGSWSLVALENLTSKTGIRWVWRKWPAPKKETERMTFMGDTGMFLPKTDADRQKGSWTWISWLFQPKQQARWCLGTGFLPLQEGALNYPTYQAQTKDRPWWGQSAEYMGHADPDHWGWYGSGGSKQAFEEMTCNILAGKVKEADLKAALTEVEAKCKKAIADASPA